jgi:hypothetical protein
MRAVASAHPQASGAPAPAGPPIACPPASPNHALSHYADDRSITAAKRTRQGARKPKISHSARTGLAAFAGLSRHNDGSAVVVPTPTGGVTRGFLLKARPL